MSFNGFLTSQGRGSAAEAVAQREDDHRRWADDGGPSPDVAVVAPAAGAPAAVAAAWPPVRRVFRRRAVA